MNKNIFVTASTPAVANAVNEAGGRAFSFADSHALAQYAVTGTLHNTFYADAETQLKQALDFAAKCTTEFVAKVAVYARKNGFMKDMPALLVAHLATRGDHVVFRQAFRLVIDDFKMLRNFMEVIRSGTVGRKSFGSMLRNEIRRFLDSRSDSELFNGIVGNSPSLADIIKMVHPKPSNERRANLYAYLIDKPYKLDLLPPEVLAFELFKKNPSGAPPAVNFQLLSSINMSTDQWAEMAKTMSWHTLRMNLNTLQRNGVMTNKDSVKLIAKRLADETTIRKTKVMPHQLLAAYLNTDSVPTEIRNALQDALEHATKNIPEFAGNVVVAVDTSGSMSSAITGNRGSATSKISCIHVAGLVGASIMRKNPNATVMPFDTVVHACNLNPRDSVMTNAMKLASFGGGGTNCGAALAKLNKDGTKADLVFYVSDNESWVQSSLTASYRNLTPMAAEWMKFKKSNPRAKLVLLDINPTSTTQKSDDKDVLNVGGFNDKVFSVVDAFLKGELGGDHFVKVVQSVDLNSGITTKGTYNE